MIHRTILQFKEDLENRYDLWMNRVNYIILHHTEVESPHNVYDVHNWHLNSKDKKIGIGYHFFIAKDGEIYIGRPLYARGAHAGDPYNDFSVGVAFEGDFNKEKMSEKQEEASVMLIALLSLANEAQVVMYKELNNERTDPGKNFPFDSLMKKVRTCRSWLEALYGEQKGADGDERGTIYWGNFDYRNLLDLMGHVDEEGERFVSRAEEEDECEE